MQDQKLTEEDARLRCDEQKQALMAAIQADQVRLAEKAIFEDRPAWAMELNERQWHLVEHCHSYVNEGAHGLPGHQLMVLVDYLASKLGLED